MTEQTLTKTKRTFSWLGPVIALVLIAEAVLALALGKHQAKQEETALLAAQVTVEATAPPAPASLGQLLGVSADDWSLTLVRSDRPLPADFMPELEEVEPGEYFDARAAAALRILIAEARADGYYSLASRLELENKALKKEYLFSSVWGSDSDSEPQTLHVHINRLRQKLGDDPKNAKRLLTVWGVGYKFV